MNRLPLLSFFYLSVAHALGNTGNNTKVVHGRRLQTNCGGGNVGNGICADPSLCCSQWGWCGSSADHCGGGSCGGGSIGDGVCADPSLCCSEFGYCGSTVEYCGTSAPVTSAPVASPVALPPPEPVVASGDSRMVAFLGNWQACPTEAQLAQYTHIIISFAVAYTWSGGPVCTPTCDIPEPVICNNAPQPELLAQWKAAGKKVILSFGGANMGGSWLAAPNGCWENCFGRETHVAQQLTNHVVNLGLDGVDLDYEYYYENNQGGSGFSKGTEAQNFIRGVTQGLRASLPAGSVVTHAPMDADVAPGTAYYDLMVELAFDNIDYLLPQYYNGIVKAHEDGFTGTGVGSMSGLDHYSNLVNNIYQGDATRVVWGFCISDCGGTGSNVNSVQAKTIMTDLSSYFTCNGGAFFWVIAHDTGASWSTDVNTVIQPNSGCSASTPTLAPVATPSTPQPTLSPTPQPTPSPTPSPTTQAPTPLPTPAPTQVTQCSATVACGTDLVCCLDTDTCQETTTQVCTGKGRNRVCTDESSFACVENGGGDGGGGCGSVDCGNAYGSKDPCNADTCCRWNNKAKTCTASGRRFLRS